MDTAAYFSGENFGAFALCGALSILIPVLMLIIYKCRNKDVPLSPFFIGCGILVVFALVLESLLHQVMIPIVSGNILTYALYGAFAAGIFEETGRLAAFGLLMKKHDDPRTALMYGMGHGGIEAILIVGVTMLSYIFIAATVNSVGIESAVQLYSAGQPENAELIRQQFEQLRSMSMGNALLSVYERIIAITVHISLSVVVFAAVKVKGKGWLYVLAVLLHAMLDFPVAFYQKGALNAPVLYVLLTLCTGIMVLVGVKCFKLAKENMAVSDGVCE